MSDEIERELSDEIEQLGRDLVRARDDLKSAVTWMERFKSERDAARAEVERLTAENERLSGLVAESQSNFDRLHNQALNLREERDQARAAIQRVRELAGDVHQSGYRWHGKECHKEHIACLAMHVMAATTAANRQALAADELSRLGQQQADGLNPLVRDER